jgi:hypothetical protein
MTPEVHCLTAVPSVIPERRLVTFACLAGGRLVRCAISGSALAVLWGRAVREEADLGEAFAACRGARRGAGAAAARRGAGRRGRAVHHAGGRGRGVPGGAGPRLLPAPVSPGKLDPVEE